MLEQRVPASYLALEDVINHVAIERRMNGLDPVLTADEYKNVVTTEMQQRYNRTFRDWAELHQATLFLHDNGELLSLFVIKKIINVNGVTYYLIICRHLTSLTLNIINFIKA